MVSFTKPAMVLAFMFQELGIIEAIIKIVAQNLVFKEEYLTIR